MANIDEIKERLSAELRATKMTQTEMAKKLNISQSCIAHYIKKDILPSIEILADLCKMLDIDANYILCNDTPKQRKNK